MAGDPPDDLFDGIEDLIDPAPLPARPEIPDVVTAPTYALPFGRNQVVFEASPVDRDRLLHELKRSFAETHPLEGPAILSRIEATILVREPDVTPRAGTCPTCGAALRVLDRPRGREVDSAERAGLLASASRSLRETRSDPASLEALARELARRDIVLTGTDGAPCPVCRYRLRLPTT